MANKSASKKDIKINQKNNERNKSVRSFIRTCIKKVNDELKSGTKESAMEALKTFEKNGMKAVSKGVFHINTVSRKISRLYARIKASFEAK